MPQFSHLCDGYNSPALPLRGSMKINTFKDKEVFGDGRPVSTRAREMVTGPLVIFLAVIK